ncbi:MAG TPA: DUF819 family protein [Saprospiraceae bacterium]|nr:DUF819 family protein [Saprospiraceae bacterium]
MSFIPESQMSIYTIAVLFLIIAVSEWLGDKPFFKHLSTGLLVIILGAVAANTGLIPATNPASPVYDAVFAYVAPISIFLILLGVNLSQIKLAGKPMLVMFVIGAFCTVIATVFALWVLNGRSFLGEHYHAVAGMLSGTYIGGSLNFNAVALHYNMAKEGDLFAATTVADNVISAVWVAVTLLMPYLLKNIWPKPKQEVIYNTNEELAEMKNEEKMNIMDATFIIFIAIVAYLFAVLLANLIPFIPMILWLTTLALICAHIPFIHRLRGHKTFGLISMYLFLTVVGTHCDIPTLLKDGALALNLMLLVTMIVVVHGVLIYSIGFMLRQDKDIISIASQANVGGTATAMALAKSLKRNELILPAILIGALGNAMGTYIGLFIANWLSQ